FEYDWWEGTEIGGVRFEAVPTQHWSNRSGFDRNRTLWCSWVVEAVGRRLLFVGDSGYGPDYREIGERFAGFDLAILPIGAYNPRWFMKFAHQDPAEAAQARRDLGARRAVASHWGTFQLTLEPMDEPPQKLAQALAAAGEDADVFWVMQHGQTRNWG
ncbi:MAG: MBL fold metallo-hydrolase, partial [Betaproteobacteria bacterium]|nr:MBL fold metallo-hydrolase [Betaproteobacteria bacterium]